MDTIICLLCVFVSCTLLVKLKAWNRQPHFSCKFEIILNCSKYCGVVGRSGQRLLCWRWRRPASLLDHLILTPGMNAENPGRATDLSKPDRGSILSCRFACSSTSLTKLTNRGGKYCILRVGCSILTADTGATLLTWDRKWWSRSMLSHMEKLKWVRLS